MVSTQSSIPGSQDLEECLQKVTIELYQRLSFFEQQSIFGRISVTFNVQKGKIQNYEIDDKMVRRPQEVATPFDKT